MDTKQLLQVKKILKKYEQEHLLCLYDELTEKERNILINQILSLDFDEILTLYQNSTKNDNKRQKVTPLEHIEKDKLTRTGN